MSGSYFLGFISPGLGVGLLGSGWGREACCLLGRGWSLDADKSVPLLVMGANYTHPAVLFRTKEDVLPSSVLAPKWEHAKLCHQHCLHDGQPLALLKLI